MSEDHPKRGDTQRPMVWFAVVCSDLHSVHGPYPDPEIADAVAQKMTRDSNCLYVPIVFVPDGETVQIEAVEEGHKNYAPKGYL